MTDHWILLSKIKQLREIICMIALSYIGILFLSLGLNNITIFYISMISIPLSINIFYDVYIKDSKMLNKTLGKVVVLLVLDACLLGIGVFI